VLKKRRFDAGKKLLEECCDGLVDFMKQKVIEFREKADEKKADGYLDEDEEFDDFDNDHNFVKEYVDIDIKFCIAKKRKLQMETKLDEIIDHI